MPDPCRVQFGAITPAATTAQRAASNAAKHKPMAIKSRGFDERDAAASAARDKTCNSQQRKTRQQLARRPSCVRPPRNQSAHWPGFCQSPSFGPANNYTIHGNANVLCTGRASRAHRVPRRDRDHMPNRRLTTQAILRVHQCAHHASNIQALHGRAAKQTTHYKKPHALIDLLWSRHSCPPAIGTGLTQTFDKSGWQPTLNP
jgi:hypothetical protein